MQSKRHQILQSAINTITQYGFRRTSMDDIAKDARMSRPAIYQYFKNKEAIAIAALELVTEQGFATARNAAQEHEDTAQILRAYISAYMVFYYRLVIAGPHADEIMQIKAQFGKDKPQQVRTLFVQEINKILYLKAEDEIGYVLATAAEGIKMAAPDEDTLRDRLAVLVEKFT